MTASYSVFLPLKWLSGDSAPSGWHCPFFRPTTTEGWTAIFAAFWRAELSNPDQRPNGQKIIKRNQIPSRHMDAAVRGGTAQSGFVAIAMDVDIAIEGVHIPAAVRARLQAFQPKDAMHNRSIRQPLPGQTDWFATAKDRADGMS